MIINAAVCGAAVELNEGAILVFEERRSELKRDILALSRKIAKKASSRSPDDIVLNKSRIELSAIRERLRIIREKRLSTAEEDEVYNLLRKKSNIVEIELQRESRSGLDKPELEAKQKILSDLRRGMRKRLKAVEPELSEDIKRFGQQQHDLRQIINWRVEVAFADHKDFTDLLGVRDEKKQLHQHLTSEILKLKREVKPEEYLASLKRPLFKEGHTMPLLTRYGWSLPLEVNKELARNWGYALAMGGYWTHRRVHRLSYPFFKEAKIAALAKSEKLKVAAITNREMPRTFPPSSWSRDAKGNLLTADAKSYDGNQWHPDIKTVISPEAPESLWHEYGRLKADPIALLREHVPVSIVLNGGEYGIGVMGFAAGAWFRDPKIRNAKKSKSWFQYISERKGRAESIIAVEVRKAVPDRDLYIYYKTGNPHRKRYPWYWIWGYDFAYMEDVSDLPSSAHYYKHFNSGFDGQEDMLTMATNIKAYDLAHGRPFDYSWFWGKHTDIGRWMGFLKCLYVLGTIGGNSGWYKYTDFSASFRLGSSPSWLKDMIALARVHAMFSYLEQILRESELVQGPYWHAWSRELPAYELIPKEEEIHALGASKSAMKYAKPGRRLRVVARKHKSKKQWIIAVWAAYGESTQVLVEIPQYGEIKVNARDVGSVYILDSQREGGHLVLVDDNPYLPSHSAAQLMQEQ